MKLDQTFKTFEEFQKFLLQWQEDTFQTFTIMKSDMFTVAEKERETLVYKKVIYGCAHGTQRKQQSQGSRPQQRTRKLDCPVSFTVKGRKRSGLLTITEEPTQQHSHALGQELWQHEPENRKLSADDVHVVKDLVLKHVSVAQITKIISAKSLKKVLTKDVHNAVGRIE